MVTLLFRGDTITPSGLSQMDALIGDIASDPKVADLLATSPILWWPLPLVVKGALQLESLESIGQAEIDSVVSAPVIQAVIEATTGTNTDGDGLRSPLSAFATRETSELMTPNGEFTDMQLKTRAPCA